MSTETTGQPAEVRLPAPGRYRVRRAEIEAVLFTAQNGRELAAWCGGRYFPEEPLGRRAVPVIEVHASFGAIPAHLGDYITRHRDGNFGVYRADVFAAIYEPAGDPAALSFAGAQDRAWANKLAKGFNITDVPMEFCLLMEEAGEAFSAWRKDRPGYGGELADVAIFLLGLAQMTDVDLGTEVAVKLAQNEARAYVRLPNGTPVKEEAHHG